jgi:hypothetical protein
VPICARGKGERHRLSSANYEPAIATWFVWWETLLGNDWNYAAVYAVSFASVAVLLRNVVFAGRAIEKRVEKPAYAGPL